MGGGGAGTDPTSADANRICKITYMLYRAVVHNLDAEFTFLEMATSNTFFSRELKILYHFSHVSILPMYLTRLTVSALVAICVFGYSFEPEQTNNMNFVTIDILVVIWIMFWNYEGHPIKNETFSKVQ